MAKTTSTTITHTCDLCGTTCVPMSRISMLHSFGLYGQDRNEIRLTVSAHVPYGPSEGDVCEKCLLDALCRHFKLQPKREARR
jgi:hypothetical protein